MTTEESSTPLEQKRQFDCDLHVFTPCGLEGGYQRLRGTFLKKIGNHLQVHAASQRRKYETTISVAISLVLHNHARWGRGEVSPRNPCARTRSFFSGTLPSLHRQRIPWNSDKA
jgi:hypothetical protein